MAPARHQQRVGESSEAATSSRACRCSAFGRMPWRQRLSVSGLVPRRAASSLQVESLDHASSAERRLNRLRGDLALTPPPQSVFFSNAVGGRAALRGDRGEPMTKQGVVPDSFSEPFWDAANEERLVIQNCRDCDRLQHPPAEACRECGAGDSLEWKPVSGRGTIYNYGVVHDCPVRLLQKDQPFNLAVITLDDDPGIQMFSHLPGTPVDDVPVGAAVEVIFEPTANGQLVPEWRVIAD